MRKIPWKARSKCDNVTEKSRISWYTKATVEEQKDTTEQKNYETRKIEMAIRMINKENFDEIKSSGKKYIFFIYIPIQSYFLNYPQFYPQLRFVN